MSSHNAPQAPENAYVPPCASRPWLNTLSNPSDSSKKYHVTAVWGKRMTLQELTHAFDAFNEAEERVALGFADSEDWNRTLAEPLSEVKTVFLDLDGLKSLSGYPSFSPASQQDNTPEVNSGATPCGRNELGYTIRMEDVTIGSNAPCTHGHPGIDLHRADDGTIKPTQKRRRSLLKNSSWGMSSQSNLKLEDERPPSRLGFLDDENIEEYGMEHGGHTL